MKQSETGLLLTGSWRYGWFRCRFFLLRTMVLLLARLAEFSVVMALWKPKFSLVYLTVRYVAQILSFYRWGQLENIRRQLSQWRTESGKGQRYQLISVTWSNGLMVGYVFLIAALLLLIPALLSTRVSDQVIWYTTAVLLAQQAWAWPLKAMQSFVYSRQRIYRPTWGMLVADLTPTIFLLAMSGKWGVYALPLALLVELLIKSPIVGYFTMKAWRQMGLGSLRWKPKWNAISWRTWKEGSNYLLSELLLLFVIAWCGQAYVAVSSLANKLQYIYVALPLILSVFSIRFLFYVDLLRYQSAVFANIAAMVKKWMTWTTLLWAVSLWLIVLILHPLATWEWPLSGLVYLLWANFMLKLFVVFVKREFWQINLYLLASIATVFFIEGAAGFWSSLVVIPLLGTVLAAKLDKEVGQSPVVMASMTYLQDKFSTDKQCYELVFNSEMNRDKLRYLVTHRGHLLGSESHFVLRTSRKLLLCPSLDVSVDLIIQFAGHRLLSWRAVQLKDFMAEEKQELQYEWQLGQPFGHQMATGERSPLGELIRMARGQEARAKFADQRMLPQFHQGKLTGLKFYGQQKRS